VPRSCYRDLLTSGNFRRLLSIDYFGSLNEPANPIPAEHLDGAELIQLPASFPRPCSSGDDVIDAGWPGFERYGDTEMLPENPAAASLGIPVHGVAGTTDWNCCGFSNKVASYEGRTAA
jgi:hypothetical protein